MPAPCSFALLLAVATFCFIAALSPALAALPRCSTPVLANSSSPVLRTTVGATAEAWHVGSESGWLIDQPAPPEGSQLDDSQLVFEVGREVAVGELLVVSFLVRAVNVTGSSTTAGTVLVQDKERVSSLSTTFPCDAPNRGWCWYAIPLRAATALGPDNGHLVFAFAFKQQTFIVTNVTLSSCVGVSDDPNAVLTAYYLPGRSEIAAWHVAAQRRIVSLRKTNLIVPIVDRNYKPVSKGVQVNVYQKKHQFLFGSAVDASLLTSNPTYSAKVKELFSVVALKRNLEWSQWSGGEQEEALDALRWLADAGILTRGTNLLTLGFSHMPAEGQELRTNATAMDLFVREHLTDVLNATRDLCFEWDIINEPFTNNDVQGLISAPGVQAVEGLLPNTSVVAYLKRAAELAPHSALYLSDVDILQGYDNKHWNYTSTYVRWLASQQRAPLHGLALKSQFKQAPIDVYELSRRIELLSSLPVRSLALTEFDFDLLAGNAMLPAVYTNAVMTLVFSSPAFSEFLLGDFWDGANLTLNAQVFANLVYGQWWTNMTAERPEANGRVEASVFKGTHIVEVALTNGTVVERREINTGYLASLTLAPFQMSWSIDPVIPDRSCGAPLTSSLVTLLASVAQHL